MTIRLALGMMLLAPIDAGARMRLRHLESTHKLVDLQPRRPGEPWAQPHMHNYTGKVELLAADPGIWVSVKTEPEPSAC